MKKPLHCFLKANNPSPTTEAPFPGASDLLTNARIRRRLTSIFYQSEDASSRFTGNFTRFYTTVTSAFLSV